MSKSVGNTIEILASPDEIRRQVMSMVTDTQRILRTDPGRPEVCNVCKLHQFFGDDWEEIQDGERTARTGCVDTKKLLAQRIIDRYATARERYAELMANPRRDRGHPRGRRGPPQAHGGGDDGRGQGRRWGCASGLAGTRRAGGSRSTVTPPRCSARALRSSSRTAPKWAGFGMFRARFRLR